MANTLNLGNGNWATKEDSLLAYNSENNNFKPLPFDFTRASNATIVNKAGLIETVGSGEPRIDFSDDAKGALLLEPQKVNQMINSEDLTGWTIQAGATVTLESINNPVNSTNANLITVNTNGVYLNRNTPDASALYSVSFWLHKNNQSGTIELTNAQGGNFGKWTINLDLLQNDFVRITRDHPSVTVVAEFTTLAAGEVAPFFKSPNGTKSFYVTGFQLEEGYATSYIPTSGSAVTRVADACNNGGNDQVINSTEGVLYAEISALANDGTVKKITLNNGNYTNQISLSYGSSSNLIDCLVYDGTVQANLTYSSSIIKDFNKIAFKYKSNNFSLWVNGIKVASTLLGVTTSLSLSAISFDNGGSGDAFYGNTKDIRVYNTALTDNELQKLTTI